MIRLHRSEEARYCLIMTTSAEEMVMQVESMMQKGWKCQGGIAGGNTGTSGSWWQAMIKEQK